MSKEPKPPKAKIQKAHALADELLAIWQTDIRPWYRKGNMWEVLGTGPSIVIDEDLIGILNTFREMRVEVER
jgi:hypothetical protein